MNSLLINYRKRRPLFRTLVSWAAEENELVLQRVSVAMNTNVHDKPTQPADLEQSCAGDWIRSAPSQAGIHRIEAFFGAEAYKPHRHDTYSIGCTISGVQSFDYRGERSHSTAGRLIVLHPDEIHNGHAGSTEGFHYRMLYLEPSLVRKALGSSASTLPFVREAVFTDARLQRAVSAAFEDINEVLEPTALDEIVFLIAEGLLAREQSIKRVKKYSVDNRALQIALDFLDSNSDRTVSSEELETVTGQDRFALARQFRVALGTSPYRYLLMRRLDRARSAIERDMRLADVAALTGFSDQAHMTRHFTSTFGVSPGRWQKLGHETRRKSIRDGQLLPTHTLNDGYRKSSGSAAAVCRATV